MENFNNKDVITMKLLHYFITEKDYNPVVLHGAKDEIWLENMHTDYKIVRIVSNYIHNDEQLDFDILKTKKIVSNIKKKTFNVNMNVLNIFIDLGENVNLHDEKNMDFVSLKSESDIRKYDFLYQYFPDIDDKLEFNEEGMNLFLKITDDINKKNLSEARKVDEMFKPKTPYVTYALIVLNVLVYLFGVLFSQSNLLVGLFADNKELVLSGDYYRLISSMFVHVDFFHVLFNMYALYILGKQAEGFFGRIKFLIIYLLSGFVGSLLSVLLMQEGTFSIGASGAIFGIMGSLLFFGFYYRVYLGNTLVRELIPVVVINLFLGFSLSGIDNFAHIGGLIGGLVVTKALGIQSKAELSDRINGIIMTLLIIGFLVFMNFFY